MITNIKNKLQDKWRELKPRLLPEDRVEKKLLYVLLASYAVILLWIIVFKCNMNEELNIQENLSKTLWERFTYRIEPFIALRTGLFHGRTNELLAGIFNIACFIPIGMALSYIMNTKRGLCISALAVLSVEIFQLFSGFGGFDYADVILNTLGTYLGYVLSGSVIKKMSARTVNIIALSLIPPLTLFAIVVFIRTIILFPV